VAALSKAWVCGRLLAGIVGLHSAGVISVVSLSVVSVVCCQVDVSGQADYLSRGSPMVCGVSECDREASTIRKPWSTTSCRAIGKKLLFVYINIHI
jgi:hypothetical protein